MKCCSKCKQDKPLEAFVIDRSRADGRAYICRECRYVPKNAGPRKAERIAMRATGLAWCRTCKKWLAIEGVRNGLCRSHASEAERLRYATDMAYQARRRFRVQARKRNILPMPLDGAAAKMELFGGECAYCPDPADTFDHLWPVQAGGNTTPYNMLPACNSCNSSKKCRDVWDWLTQTGRADTLPAHNIEQIAYQEYAAP